MNNQDLEVQTIVHQFGHYQSKHDTQAVKMAQDIEALIRQEKIAELELLAALTPCNAHEQPSHSCADWMHDNIVERIAELKSQGEVK